MLFIVDPLLQSIAAAARRLSREWAMRDMANTAWSFSTRVMIVLPLMDAIAARARNLQVTREFRSHDLRIILWSMWALDGVFCSWPCADDGGGLTVFRSAWPEAFDLDQVYAAMVASWSGQPW